MRLSFYSAVVSLRSEVNSNGVSRKRRSCDFVNLNAYFLNGRGYTRLVFRSYYDQRITLNDVSSYLGAKVKYIAALERAAFLRAE